MRKRKSLEKFMWVEKYRPESIENVILPNDFKKYFESVIEDGETGNLLLYSSTPGSGKTSVARAIARDLGVKPFYINISNEGGIDVLRTDVSKYASIKTLDGKPKIVIMDEFDGASRNLQDALRADIEKFSNSCRFIMVCNYITKIIDPLKEGRTQVFDFNMTENSVKNEMYPKIYNRLTGILKNENVEYDGDTVQELIKRYFPNIRKMISLLQKYSKINGMIDNQIFKYTVIDDEYLTLIQEGELTKARTYALDKNFDFDEMYTVLFRKFVPLLEKDSQPQAILVIADYMHQSATAIDKEITYTACLIELMNDCL